MSIILIIDTSYSINHILDNYFKSINSIIDEQLSINKFTKYSIITFNDEQKILCINEQIGISKRRLSRDDLKPNGFTRLYDSVSSILVHFDKFYEKNSESPTVIILTDGDDTASKKISLSQLYLQIARNKQKGWKFIYLGITEKSLKIGREIGANITILYNTSHESFSFLPQLMKDIFIKNIGENENTEIDISDILKNMSNLKI